MRWPRKNISTVAGIPRHTHHPIGLRDIAQLLGQIQQSHLVLDARLIQRSHNLSSTSAQVGSGDEHGLPLPLIELDDAPIKLPQTDTDLIRL